MNNIIRQFQKAEMEVYKVFSEEYKDFMDTIHNKIIDLVNDDAMNAENSYINATSNILLVINPEYNLNSIDIIDCMDFARYCYYNRLQREDEA